MSARETTSPYSDVEQVKRSQADERAVTTRLRKELPMTRKASDVPENTKGWTW